MIGTCERCGERFALARTGRTPRFCSGRCRVAAHRAIVLPAELTTGRRFTRADGKRPITLSGHAASSTDRSTWATYGEVRRGPFGIMLGDGIGCYDLDHVTDAEARAFIATIPEPVIFAERSVSGEGVHVFFRAAEGLGYRRGHIERYTRARFIRMTGRRFA